MTAATEHSTPLASMLAMSIEFAINSALKTDPSSRKKFNQLMGRSLQINCQQPSVTLQFIFCENAIAVHGNPNSTADAQVTGTAKAFIQLATSNDGHSLADTGICVQGNANLLTAIQDIAKTIEIDWEDLLTPIGSPAVSHFIASGIKSFSQQALKQKNFVEQNLASILADELQCIPSQQELDQFYDDVDSMATKTQRLEARIRAYILQRTPHQ